MYIGEKETKWLFIILLTSRVFTGSIYGFVKNAGTAAAISALVCVLLVLIYFWAVEKIKADNGTGLFKMMRESYGRAATVIIGSVLTVLSVLNCSARLRMFTATVSDIVLPDSPFSYTVLFFAAAVIAVSFLGLESITRYAYVTGIVISALLAAVCIFNLKGYNVLNICPVMGKGFSGFLSGTKMIYMFSDLFYIYLLADFFKNRGAVMRTGIKAIAVSGIIIAALVFFYCLAVPYPSSADCKYQLLRLASLANVSVLFQRLDGAVYIIWLFSGFICTGALALFTMMIFSETFMTDDYRGCVPIIVFIVVSLSQLGGKYTGFVNSLFATAVFSVTFVTAIVYRFKKMPGRKKDET